MADDVSILIRLRESMKAARDARTVAAGVHSIGDAAQSATRQAARMGPALQKATGAAERGLGAVAHQARYGVFGLGALAVAGAKWGLSFNAQVESSRERFRLFTNDVDGLTRNVQGIDRNSQFNFADLADAAAMFGNSGVQNIPKVLQGAANAAAASGKGTAGLQSIVIALSQIASKGRLSQEEINQLNEAGAPGAQKIIADGFHLTAKQLQNLGGQGLDAKKALDLLTGAWTSGKMAQAAARQTKTLGGQWQLFTGNAQKAAGALTQGLAHDLERDVLPAANRAASAITAIFGDEGLSNAQKLQRARHVINRELGPIADDLKDAIDQADIPGHLGDVIGKSIPFMVSAAADAAPHVASAFVKAWLHSGPWAQLASVLYVGAKVKGARGVGGGKGGLAGSLLGKGSSPLNPLFVAVVNGGGDLPGGVPGGGKSGGGVGRFARGAARTVLPAAIAYEFVHALNQTGGHDPRLAEAARTTPQGTNPRVANAYLNTHPGPNLFATVISKIDGREAARGTARANLKTNARKG